jgi:hypothetical protein
MNSSGRLKPLEDYLKDIHSRNMKYGKIFPYLDKTVENISTYDELYKKLIEESYLMCSELYTAKAGGNSNTINIEESYNINPNVNENPEPDNDRVKKALIFKSTESINPQNSKTRNNANNEFLYEGGGGGGNIHNIISPIIKQYNPDNKSGFYSTNKFNNTDSKNALKKVDMAPSNTNKVNNNIPKEKIFANEEMLYLINNSKEIEHLLIKDETVEKIEIFENRIQRGIRKAEEIEHMQLEIIENRQDIDLKTKEITKLLNQFNERFGKLDEYMGYIQCEEIRDSREGGGENLNRSNVYSCKSQPRETVENNYIYSNTEEGTTDRTRLNFSHQHPQNNSFHNPKMNQYTSLSDRLLNDSKERLNVKDMSSKINSLFANYKLKDACELWKTIGYCKFETTSLERSFEMLQQIIKLKDREIEILTQRIKQFEVKEMDIKKKDAEIVELFAELEVYKGKMKNMNEKTNSLQIIEHKMSVLIKENSLLFKENAKLKMLLQQEKYLKMHV